MFDCYNISYTDYIRTTEDRHKCAVQKFWVSSVKLGILGLGLIVVLFRSPLSWINDFIFAFLHINACLKVSVEMPYQSTQNTIFNGEINMYETF